MKRILLIFFIIFLYSEARSQIDNDFWMVAPEAYTGHGDRPIYMRISTMEDPAIITLSMPACPSFPPVNQSIPANTTYSINLTTWIDSIENKPANKILNRGMHLVSDKLVTAYYEIAHPNNPAIFPMKGKNGLGTYFFIIGQNNYPNQYAQSTEAFDIIATEDSTWVYVTPSVDITGHPAGITFAVLLNKGQTYSARTTNTTAPVTLAGSQVSSSKPIAITISDDSVLMGPGDGWDIIGDQIIPVNLLGKEYIVVKGYANNVPSNNDEKVYVLATKDNTSVRLYGQAAPVAILSTGQLFSYTINPDSANVYIKADQPVYVYHLSGNPGECGSSLIPHDSCTGSKQIGFNRTGIDFFAMLILTRAGNEDAFLLNGSNSVITAADFSPVFGSGGAWVYARKTMNTLQVPVGANLLQNTDGKFHLGIINNLGGSSEYGYYSAYSSLYLGADRSMCHGDSIQLDGGPYMNSYTWYKYTGGAYVPVGSSRYYTVHDTGYYAAEVTGDNCSLRDTIHIGFYPDETVFLGNDTTICQGTTLVLDPGQFSSYLWQDGGLGRYYFVSAPGTYWVKVVNINGCKARDTITVGVQPYPVPSGPLSGPDTVCQGQTGVTFTVAPFSDATSYQWILPPGYTGTSTTNTISLDFSLLAVADTIKVRAINGCGTSTLMVKKGIFVRPFPGPSGAISGPASVCQGENNVSFSIPPVANATGYDWTLPPGATITSGSNTNSITLSFSLSSSSGTITASGTNVCGTGTPSSIPLTVNLFPQPAGSITGAAVVCQGQTSLQYSIPPVTGADSVIWTLPPGASIISGKGSNIITVKFDSSALSGSVTAYGKSNICGNGLPSSMPVTVNPLPSPAGSISGPASVCQGQNSVVFTVPPIANANTYEWTVPAGAVITSGGTTNSITVNFTTSAVSGTVTVKGQNPLCGYGLTSVFPLTVNPLPAAAGQITGPAPVCQASSANLFTVPAIMNAASYIWNFTGTGANPVNMGNVLRLDFSSSATTGILTVKGNNFCGDGPISSGYQITVNPIPLTSLNICNTLTTHDAKPFTLRGGLPVNGTYSGTGVSAGKFFPQNVPLFKDTAIVHYLYTNVYGCTNAATQIISLQNVTFFCGGLLTDIRDNKTYSTIQIGSQCWMSENLNYGAMINEGQMQTDNCSPEKYCFNNSSAMCSSLGGLYQWNELMAYDNVQASQGICPPSWHIPTENEWNTLFAQFINNGFAGSPLKSTGFSGFDVLMTGARFLNKSWDMDNFSTFLWSSTPRGVTKAWAHGLNIYNPSISVYPATVSNAFSVRCVKD